MAKAKKRKPKKPAADASPLAHLWYAFMADEAFHPIQASKRWNTSRRKRKVAWLKEKEKLSAQRDKDRADLDAVRARKAKAKRDALTRAQGRTEGRKVAATIVRPSKPPQARPPRPAQKKAEPASSRRRDARMGDPKRNLGPDDSFLTPEEQRAAKPAPPAGVCGELTIESDFTKKCQRPGKCPPGTHVEGQQAIAKGPTPPIRTVDPITGGPLTPAEQSFFQLRDSGYAGPIDQNGRAVGKPSLFSGLLSPLLAQPDKPTQRKD